MKITINPMLMQLALFAYGVATIGAAVTLGMDKDGFRWEVLVLMPPLYVVQVLLWTWGRWRFEMN